MATAAPRPCTSPGCRELVRDGSGRCAAHARSWVKVKPTKRITGRRLQAMRESLFRRQPVCEQCRRQLATQRDHIKPLEEGGADDSTNEQALCEDCHAEKSKAEAIRGRLRARGGG